MQNSQINIAIVDDHQIVIDGLMAALKHFHDLNVLYTAISGKIILEKMQNRLPDILLTDVMMPGMSGQELSGLVKKLYPTVKIIALSMNDSGFVVEEMIKNADINGYILKQSSVGELYDCIVKVNAGKQCFDERVLEKLEDSAKISNKVRAINITHREMEIIELMEKDFSNKEISSALNISVRTVETHRKNIFRKTGTNNLLSLVKWAYEHRILQNEK